MPHPAALPLRLGHPRPLVDAIPPEHQWTARDPDLPPALQDLGEALVALSADRLARIELPDSLRAAIDEARRIHKFGALRRQLQYIGKLMRSVDVERHHGVAAEGHGAWVRDRLHAETLAVAERAGLKLGKAQAPVRVAVTGRTVGPPLFEALEVLGAETVLGRLRAARARL